MNVHASRNVSAILRRTITTLSRRRQNADVASLSHCTRLFLVGNTPMLYNLRRCACICMYECHPLSGVVVVCLGHITVVWPELHETHRPENSGPR
jgi:hypothetical protein